jgi:hypothetical protein
MRKIYNCSSIPFVLFMLMLAFLPIFADLLRIALARTTRNSWTGTGVTPITVEPVLKTTVEIFDSTYIEFS